MTERDVCRLGERCVSEGRSKGLRKCIKGSSVTACGFSLINYPAIKLNVISNSFGYYLTDEE